MPLIPFERIVSIQIFIYSCFICLDWNHEIYIIRPRIFLINVRIYSNPIAYINAHIFQTISQCVHYHNILNWRCLTIISIHLWHIKFKWWKLLGRWWWILIVTIIFLPSPCVYIKTRTPMRINQTITINWTQTYMRDIQSTAKFVLILILMNELLCHIDILTSVIFENCIILKKESFSTYQKNKSPRRKTRVPRQPPEQQNSGVQDEETNRHTGLLKILDANLHETLNSPGIFLQRKNMIYKQCVEL